jgi:glycosyltransferase involved in cell wall biosynthesis
MNVLRFAGWMKDEGYTVSVWCVSDSPLGEAAQAAKHRCVFIKHHVKYGDLKGAIRLAKLFTEHEVDVVWIRDTRDMSICGWAKRWSTRKISILYQQAMQLGVSKRDPVHTDRFKRIDAWVAPLNYLAEQVKTMTRYPANRIAVIPLAVDVERFSSALSKNEARTALGLPTDRLLLGTVGRIDPLKGQAFLIEQFASICEKGLDVDLVIVGDPTRNEGDAYLKQLKQLAETASVQGRVHFRPHRDDVEKVYRALDVFAMASTGETFGMVTIEAMVSGCAVVGTNRSGTPELLADGRGALYEPDDSASFLEAVEPVLVDAEVRAAMSAKAYAHAASTFHRQRVLEQLRHLVNTLG